MSILIQKRHPYTVNLNSETLGDSKIPFLHWGDVLAVWHDRYAMREALAISSEEGLKEQWQRHENMHHMLWDGLKSMGLKSFVENDSERLITVNTITVRHSHHGVIIMFLLWYVLFYHCFDDPRGHLLFVVN